MPSPFPGMDPFIEGQCWRDFHTSFITVVREYMTPFVRPRYTVEVEEYVYLAAESEKTEVLEPDVSIVESKSAGGGSETATTATLAVEPAVLTLPMPDRIRQPFLTIRDRRSRRVVTVIELLSPWNKSGGFREYLEKRQNIFAASVHLVELDLLRGGRRLPTQEPLPPGDYFAFVCRTDRLPEVEVYAWPLAQRLPQVRIPLAHGDEDVVLDVAAVFTTTYDRAGYDYSLDYADELEPSTDEATLRWVKEMLKKES